MMLEKDTEELSFVCTFGFPSGSTWLNLRGFKSGLGISK